MEGGEEGRSCGGEGVAVIWEDQGVRKIYGRFGRKLLDDKKFNV